MTDSNRTEKIDARTLRAENRELQTKIETFSNFVSTHDLSNRNKNI